MNKRRECLHYFVTIGDGKTRQCPQCGYSVRWDIIAEKEYIRDVFKSLSHTPEKKKEILKGLIKAYWTYESVNTSREEDIMIMDYAQELVGQLP